MGVGEQIGRNRKADSCSLNSLQEKEEGRNNGWFPTKPCLRVQQIPGGKVQGPGKKIE